MLRHAHALEMAGEGVPLCDPAPANFQCRLATAHKSSMAWRIADSTTAPTATGRALLKLRTP
jgi:hypothetical protein